MNQYWYLVASLPDLRFGEKPLMGRDAFLASCTEWLPEQDVTVLKVVLDNRSPPVHGIAQRWWNGEVQLRNAAVRVRAKKLNMDPSRFVVPPEAFNLSIEKMVTDAFTRTNPLEQETELDRVRWAQADELALSNPFAFPGILAFAVKLRIAERWEKMSADQGRSYVEELISVSLKSDNPITDNG